MKLIKVGSSPSCDIVLNSPVVSAKHAEITLLDDGSILVEDKNSTNGTVVGNAAIKPGVEVPVHRGDFVRFADTNLVWARVPSVENNDKYKTILNIGSNFRNDIIVNNGTVSRYHAAVKVEKGGKAFIIDNGSKNGTSVNGVKIQKNKLVQIHRGDNIVCGSEDVTDQIKPFIPSFMTKWAWGGVATLAAAVIALLIVFLPDMLKGCTGTLNPEDFRSAVVYVRAAYHYNVTVESSPLGNEDSKKLLVQNSPALPYQATAFFLDREGRMGTNRHVAVPWDEAYRQEGLTEKLTTAYKEWLLDQLKVTDFQFFFMAGQIDAIQTLKRSALGRALLNEADSFSELQAMINILQNSKIVISGEIDYITVGFPGKYYTHEDEFQRCNVLCESGDKEKDVAILQLNNKETPSNIIQVFNLHDIMTETMVPLKDRLFLIGYPAGLQWAMDDKTKSLEPNIRDTRCSKMPGKYSFEFESSSTGGASGSPIFNEKGQLAGILFGGVEQHDLTFAVHAKFLKKMYDEEVGTDAE